MTIQRINAGKNHYYKIDGQKADGVTTLIKNGVPKGWLGFWAAKVVAEFVADSTEDYLWALKQGGRDSMADYLKRIPWQVRDAAAVRGSDVHDIAEKLVTGAAVEVPEHLAGHVDAAIKFMEDWDVRPVLTERPVGCRQWMYAGTFDLIADVRGGERLLLDYKTGAKGIFPETAMQLAAYRYADAYLGTDNVTEVPMSEIGIDRCAAVWLRADGYDVIPVNTDSDVYRTFLHVAHVARQMDVMKSWILPSEVPVG